MNPLLIQAMQAAASGGSATPQQALQAQMAAMHQKVKPGHADLVKESSC